MLRCMFSPWETVEEKSILKTNKKKKKKKTEYKKSPSPGIEPGVAGGFVPKNLKANSVTDYTIREHIYLGKEFISVSEPIFENFRIFYGHKKL